MTRDKERPSLALIIGSGFSAEAGLPTTSELAKGFLETPNDGVLPPELEDRITTILREYWHYVFGATHRKPSLENHFTLLDLAANSGHHLGLKFSPKKLRAIRRMSIHRVFQILDKEYHHSIDIEILISTLLKHFAVSIVSLNWDIVVENSMDLPVDYGIPVESLADGSSLQGPNRLTLLKVHGSSNWMYCDCCHRIYGGTRKSALHRKVFLEASDFDLFGGSHASVTSQLQLVKERACTHCGNRMAGRLATFSYRKALSVNQFQTIWDCAHKVLSRSDIWLFAGYSMPEADFEFRYLLKSAQLARRDLSRWNCEVVLKDDATATERYLTFFDIKPQQVTSAGLADWVQKRLDPFCRERGAKP